MQNYSHTGKANIYYRIFCVYLLNKRPLTAESHLAISNMEGYFVRTVTKFGNSAKVDCPGEYLGRMVYLVIV